MRECGKDCVANRSAKESTNSKYRLLSFVYGVLLVNKPDNVDWVEHGVVFIAEVAGRLPSVSASTT